MERYKRLGDILVSEGIATQEQIKDAVSVQEKEGGKLGEILVKLGYVTEEQIGLSLSKQLSLSYISLSSENIKPAPDQDLGKLIPYDVAIRNIVLPLSHKANSLTVAMFNPLDLILIDNLKRLTGCQINPVISTKSEILKAIDDFYAKEDFFGTAMDTTGAEEPIQEVKESKTDEEGLSLDKVIAQAQEAAVVKLVDLIIKQAIEENVSDIHFEPFHDHFSLRYRIDGVLYEKPSPKTHLCLPIISRIKILSKMDIAQKRLPQDGGFTIKLEGRFIDLRVSILPTIYGEKAVIKILDKSRVSLELAKLGFLPQELELIRKGISIPNGATLLSGPIGSGKSTTLYAVLNELYSPEKNIVTIEDPVEYRLEGINQAQVKPEIGLTFASALKYILRQDPDIVLVGEIRDLETAEISVRASLAGHVVLSTLYVNDAASTIIRLIDIGIPTYLVAAALRLVVAQRLVRKLCPDCKEPYEVKKEDLPSGISLTSPVIYKAKGCQNCNFIGYKDRVLIAEVLLIDDEIRELIHAGLRLAGQLKEVAKKKGMLSFLESGIKRVEEGLTSLEEVFSVYY
ncbi:MAG: Flp pilus assembly complex ATPase component TadA [Candidatus Omnitrophota bacterium]|nr:MAG: Flp pilus assembly complex ATPase component TadA [Candidatus Omnitrophota bacterium]